MNEEIRDDIRKAVETMRAGGVVLYPTDTIWGLGCDATNAEAVEKIYKIKQRAESKAMIVLVDGPAKVAAYVQEMPDVAYDLIEVADRPLTIIYDHGRSLAHNLTAADGSIAIRVTNELFSKALCQAMRVPIVSTSANISGEKAPAQFAQIDKNIIQAVDYVVRYRQNDTSESTPSSILKLGSHGEVKIIR